MPIDTSIYQQPPSQGFNTPFQTLAQIGAIQRQRQEIASEKALEQERQQKLADQQRSVQSDQVLSQLFQQHTKLNPDTGVTETDHQAVYNGLMGVDPKKAEAYLTVADAAQQRFNAFQLQHQQLAKGALDLQNGLVQIVKDAPPDKRADVWAINRVALGTVNPGVLDHIPQQYPGDDELDKLMNKGLSLSEQIANKFKASETAKNLAEAKKAEADAGKAPKVTFERPEQAMVGGKLQFIRPGSDGKVYDMQGKEVDASQIQPKPDKPEKEPAASYQLQPEIDPKTGAQTGRFLGFNTKTNTWEPVKGEGPKSTKPAPGAAQAAQEFGTTQKALDTLTQLDAAIEAAKDKVGPGKGRVENVEQMIGSADPAIQKLGVKMKAAKMRFDHAVTGSVRAGASPLLLQQWDNILANKVTPEGLKAGVAAMREILGGDSSPATQGGGGLPTVGGTFQGGKVLKIEKVSD